MKYELNLDWLLNKVSPPSRGAWIEIIVVVIFRQLNHVAPLAGGVD